MSEEILHIYYGEGRGEGVFYLGVRPEGLTSQVIVFAWSGLPA